MNKLDTIALPATRSMRIILLFVMVILFFLATVLLTYSIYFFYVFEHFNNTTSYFPWAWRDSISSLTSVLLLMASGLIPSVGVIAFTFASSTRIARTLFEVQPSKIEDKKVRESVAQPLKLDQKKAKEAKVRSRPYRRRSKSQIGAITLLILSVALLVASYKYANIVIEVDSVVAFAAALVLIYKDTSHSMQLRVVDSILDSTQAEVSQLATLKFPSQSYVHELKGRKITDVFLVPSSVSNEGSTDTTNADLIPPGRSLAQLFLRELAKTGPSLQDLSDAMQPIFSESLGLSWKSGMQLTSADSVTVTILRPLLDCPCSQDDGSHSDYSLVCVVCSLLAVVICFASRKTVSIKSCHHDAEENVATIEYHLE